MSTATPPAPQQQSAAPSTRRGSGLKLGMSAYEQVASGLVSALIFVGVIVAIILVLYFSTRIFAKQKAVEVTMADVGGREGAIQGAAEDLEEPGAEEVPEIMENTSMQALEAVATVSTKAAMLDDMTLQSEFVAGPGKGKGDSRAPGNGKGGRQEMVPRDERWVIRFEGGDLKVYARQLDSFGIELAALGGEQNLVYYAFHLAKSKPDSRTGTSDAEQRLYMTWRSGPLQQADRTLLARSGVKLDGKVVMQFYPIETERLLATLEAQYAKGRDVNEIRRTTFDVKVNGDKYEFVVANQQYF